MEIKNIKKAGERILTAIKSKERIVLLGDADLDGVASVIVLKEAVQNLGGKIPAVYFPDREKEGYGISKTALSCLKKFSPALLVALDCGIGNIKEAESAKRSGFEVIIVDHHEPLDRLPKASIIVDPKQKTDKYPFKGLAAAGLAFKVAETILAEKMTKNVRLNFLELVCLATIADMMPQEQDNEIFIQEGLKSLENSWRPGISALFSSGYLGIQDNLKQKISKAVSLLNCRDVEKKYPSSFRLFCASSQEEAREILRALAEKQEERKNRIKEILSQVEEEIKKEELAVIFAGSPHWDYPLISTVASILVPRYRKPIFLYKKLKKESQGSVRTPPGVNSVQLMKKCRKYLSTYGGHPQAAGFRIKNENLEKFKKCLIKNLKS